MTVEFDPNGPGHSGQIFGLPFNYEESSIVIIPIPWDVTVSYRGGTSKGPVAILDASSQVDLFLKNNPRPWQNGIYMLRIENWIEELNTQMRVLARDHIDLLESLQVDHSSQDNLLKVNKASERLNSWVKETTAKVLTDGKYPVLVGGDHSSPYGYIESLAQEKSFGILQIDAHADLRKAYEGFEHSHASIMHNVLKFDGVESLVQIGVRDLCEEEANRIDRDDRIHTFFDKEMKAEMFNGVGWAEIVERILFLLPENVYISFDIDGLNPSLCPNTGTPAPGGLSFEMAMYLIEIVAKSRQVVGFDLCEVSPGKDSEWDANVGARVLYNVIAHLH